MTGIYSMGLVGYRVTLTDELIREGKAKAVFVGTESQQKERKYKIHYNTSGRAYIKPNGNKVYLDECIRTTD